MSAPRWTGPEEETYICGLVSSSRFASPSGGDPSTWPWTPHSTPPPKTRTCAKEQDTPKIQHLIELLLAVYEFANKHKAKYYY